MQEKDFYNVLGVSKNSPKEDIKKAYRALAHKHHPDKGGDEKKFKEINEAYQILGDDKKRAQYDQFGSAAFDGAGAREGYGPFGFNFSGFGSSDEGRFGFEGFEDIFDNFFGGNSGRGGAKTKKGSNIMMEMELSFEEAALGMERKINLYSFVKCQKCSGTGLEIGSKFVKCKSCGGNGSVEKTSRTILGVFSQTVICEQCGGGGEIPEKVCHDCSGEGRKKETRTVSIKIPGGIENGQTIKLDGQGNVGTKNSPAGDIYVKIKVKPHEFFKRRGSDVYYEKYISFTQATLGDKIEIPTLHGNVKLTIPAGIESGKLIRISGKGAGRLRGIGKGDMYVEIKLVIPKKISKKAKKLLEELKEEGI